MKKSLLFVILSCVVAIVFITPAFADTVWTKSSGSNDWSNGANWNNGPGGDGNFGQGTISVATDTENIYYLNSRWTFYSGSGFTINNNDGSNTGTNHMIIGSDGNAYYVDGDYMWVQKNGKLEISNGSSLTAYHQFHLDSGGELILNNGSINIQNSDIGNFIINGTLTSKNGGTLNADAFSFANGVVVSSGGQVQVQSGLLWVETGGNTSANGFQLNSGATLTVNSGATFALDRNNTAWGSLDSSNPQINGTVMLNDGSITVYYNGNQATDRGMDNHGTIQGSGTLAIRVRQGDDGYVIASNGVLNLFQTIAGNQQTFTAATAGHYGTFKAVSNGTMRINGDVAVGVGFGGAWIVDNGGTLEVATGKSLDLGQAYMIGGNLNGTIKVNSGANMTIAAGAEFGPTLNQNGTFLFNDGTIQMVNITGLDRFTNSTSGVLTGNGTFRTGYGVGQNNYGILNQGTVIATNGMLTMFSDDAADLGGFQNQGTVRIANGSTLTITRSDNAWNTGVIASPTNLNFISMEGGTLRGSNTSVGVLAGQLVNANSGSISGCGTFENFAGFLNNGTVQTDCGGSLTFTGSVTNNGTMRAVNGSVLESYGPVVNNGIIDIMNGTTNFHSTFINNSIVVDASYFKVTSITKQSNDINIMWTTLGGRSYVVQTNAPPLSGSYTNDFADLSPTIAVPGTNLGTTNYLDVGAATNVPFRYYRVRLVP